MFRNKTPYAGTNRIRFLGYNLSHGTMSGAPPFIQDAKVFKKWIDVG